MRYYDLSKFERQKIVRETEDNILNEFLDLSKCSDNSITHSMIIPKIILDYSQDNDTYIRKNAYLSIGRIFFANNYLKGIILQVLGVMLKHKNEKVRQTSVYALGEIGKKDGDTVMRLLETALIDKHHSVRNALIGALKQMGLKNPKFTFEFAHKHLHDDNPQIRREIIHGIELRGRTHPEEVLPLLKELQYEEAKPVRNMIIHVIGQISYKKGCLEKVVENLKTWKNREIVLEATEEIIDVHKRYKFASRSTEYAVNFIKKNLIVN
jgi:HEAT repeat protein